MGKEPWQKYYGEGKRVAEIWELSDKPEKGPDGSMIYNVHFVDCRGEENTAWGKSRKVRTYPYAAISRDLRTLEDMQNGCCPPQLMNEILEGGGS